MHGATSGHLLVTCNNSIVIIDFSVLKTSTYSFFIEEELCELTIERKEDQFFYGFEVDQEADTPLNQQRKKRDKKHLFQSIFLLGGILLLVSILIVGMTHYHSPENRSQLLEKLQLDGKESMARVILKSKLEGSDASYVFFANGRSYTSSTTLAGAEENGFILDIGMPLEDGDEFLVQYLPGSPQQNLINFEHPSPKTLEKYHHRALEKYLELYPNTSTEQANCLVETAYELKQVDGLADFYFSSTRPKDNPTHNKNSFLRLIRDLPFEQLSAKKCRTY